MAKAKVSGWQPGARFDYQWLLGKKLIKGQTGPRLTLKKRWRGKLKVRVEARLPGYLDVTVSSQATRIPN